MLIEANAFEKMKNLKYLWVSNVHITCEELKYLPNELRLIEWSELQVPLPSKFCPQRLVQLDMPRSRIRLETTFKLV